MSYDTNLMVEVSVLYYKNKLKQESIARKLKISKYQVNRILKRASRMGIVQVNVIDPAFDHRKIEDELVEKFNIKRAIVVENFGLTEKELKTSLGIAASSYLQEIINSNDTIGISWGTTINEVINNLPIMKDRNVEVVQITGGSNELSVDLNCHDITRRFASKFNVQPHLLYAPAMVSSKRMHDLLINEVSIKKIFEYFKKLTIALVGIGAIYPKTISTLVKTGHINNDDLKLLKKRGAVGDVYSHFFDINGKICDNNMSGRLIAMPVKDLLKVPLSVGVAGGKLKAEAILGALRGKYINVLITDHTAAQKLLEI